ncbi:hypothetical protein FJZ53_00790 [Candidatus Woesearchaeota archaeon]|nr:hypothetical protein [Candidatus Woesearchaeota archaeon]
MKDLKTALEDRKKVKDKKPNFLKQDAQKKSSLYSDWRRPRGRHSKMRLRKKGRRKRPSMGYSSPQLVRGLNPDGVKEKLVYNLEDLSSVGKNEGVIISGNIGLRKKIEMLKKIQELKLTLLNLKDINAFIKQTEESFLAKKQESKKKEEEKKQAKEEAVKKAEEKKKEEEKKTEDQKKVEEEEKAKEDARKKAMQQPV